MPNLAPMLLPSFWMGLVLIVLVVIGALLAAVLGGGVRNGSEPAYSSKRFFVLWSSWAAIICLIIWFVWAAFEVGLHG